MHYDTDVQFNGGPIGERVWLSLSDPTDIAGEITERITLDIPSEDFAFLKQWALYLNALAKVSLSKQPGTKGVKARSRKSLAESSLHARLIEQRAKLQAMFDEVGPFPSVSSSKVTRDEMDAMIAYVKRVLAWDKKNSSK